MRKLGAACWGMRELGLEQQLELCGRLGVQMTELDIANGPRGLSLSGDPKELETTAEMFERYDMPLEYAATGNDFTLENGEDVMRQVKKVCRVIELCESLRVRFLRIFAGFSPADDISESRFERLAGSLENVCRYAGEHGVRLALELHGGVRPRGTGVEHFHSASTEWKLVKRLLEEGPKDLCFLLDPANIWAVGEDPVRYYEILRGRIAYMHAKEFAFLEDGSLIPAACGACGFDWEGFFTAAQDFEGPVMVEYEQTEDVEQGMQDSLDYLCALFEKLKERGGLL